MKWKERRQAKQEFKDEERQLRRQKLDQIEKAYDDMVPIGLVGANSGWLRHCPLCKCVQVMVCTSTMPPPLGSPYSRVTNNEIPQMEWQHLQFTRKFGQTVLKSITQCPHNVVNEVKQPLVVRE